MITAAAPTGQVGVPWTAGADNVGTTTPAPASSEVPFHPGHYFYLGASPELLNNPNAWRDVLLAHPKLQGHHQQYSWRGLEPSLGVYDFGQLKSDLNWLADHDRYLIIQFQTKSFDEDRYFFPDYIRDRGHYFRAASNPPVVGFNVKWWEPYVRGRVKALVTALDTQLTAKERSALEGFWISEMAGEPVECASGGECLNDHRDAIISGMVDVLGHARSALGVMSGQYTNRWTGIGAPHTFEAYVPAAVGIGHNILPRGIYTAGTDDSSRNTFLGLKAAAYPGMPADAVPAPGAVAETHILESPQGGIYSIYPYTSAADVMNTLRYMGAHYVNWMRGSTANFSFDDIMALIDDDELIAINTTRPRSLA